TSSHERTSFGCAARSASRQSKFSALRCGQRHRCAVGDDAVPESFPGSHELFDQPLSVGVVLVILDDEQRGFHYTLSASISSYSWCVPTEREDLIRRAMTSDKATFSRAMSLSSKWPIFRPIRVRRIVTGLSAITCDRLRRPFRVLGSSRRRRASSVIELGDGFDPFQRLELAEPV